MSANEVMNMHSRLTCSALLVFVSAVIGLAGQNVTNPEAAKLKNPVAATSESIAAGKKAYDVNCAGCHGNMAQGAETAGIAITIIQEQGGKQAPDLTDDKTDHGSTDGEIYAVIKKGIPPTMMAGWDGRISDMEIWSIPTAARPSAGAGPWRSGRDARRRPTIRGG